MHLLGPAQVKMFRENNIFSDLKVNFQTIELVAASAPLLEAQAGKGRIAPLLALNAPLLERTKFYTANLHLSK